MNNPDNQLYLDRQTALRKRISIAAALFSLMGGGIFLSGAVFATKPSLPGILIGILALSFCIACALLFRQCGRGIFDHYSAVGGWALCMILQIFALFSGSGLLVLLKSESIFFYFRAGSIFLSISIGLCAIAMAVETTIKYPYQSHRSKRLFFR